MGIKEEIHALSEEMVENLGRLVAIDSQLGTPAEGMPFGEGPAKALEEGLKIAEELGFETVNLDNYCGYAQMGEGEDIIGIAGHLDVVPAGGDWKHEPFRLTREGDYVYGRGTTDDKGPVIEALYAMKLLRDSGVKINKRVRLIMGCNEETGSKCMEHYNEVEEELSCGFTPDGNFPCIHGEKGMLGMRAYSKNTRIISMNGGFVPNAVCDSCTTVIPASDGLKERIEKALSETKLQTYKVTEENGQISIYAKGVSAHASTPALGVNAAGVTFECLAKAGFEDDFVEFYNTHIGTSFDGSGIGLKYEDEYGAFRHYLVYEGIIYVVLNDKPELGKEEVDNAEYIDYVILTNDIYSLSIGIQVGMSEKELTETGIDFSVIKNGDDLDSEFLSGKTGYLRKMKIAYDTIYYGESSYDENIAIAVIVKNGKVVRIATDKLY